MNTPDKNCFVCGKPCYGYKCMPCRKHSKGQRLSQSKTKIKYYAKNNKKRIENKECHFDVVTHLREIKNNVTN